MYVLLFWNERYSFKSTVSSQLFGSGSAPGLFFSLYHSSEQGFLSSSALEVVPISLYSFVELVSLTLSERGRTAFTHMGSYRLHMASLHFLAMSVSNACCITDDDRENKDEYEEKSGLKWKKETRRDCQLHVTYRIAVKP